jgi:hypothetical protein
LFHETATEAFFLVFRAAAHLTGRDKWVVHVGVNEAGCGLTRAQMLEGIASIVSWFESGCHIV